jgi:catechol 2,3-dioxygenase
MNAAPLTAVTSSTLPADLHLGAVHLTVADVDRSVTWYERALGLVVQARNGDRATLTDGRATLVVLREDATARQPGAEAGLYHYALLYRDRAALALAAMRLIATRTPVSGASDHQTHEAIYLNDVDGNGIELAADRPRDRWPAGLGYDGGPAPLDFEALLSSAAGQTPGAQISEGMKVGHVHLHVGDIDEGLAFYCDVLGFELQANIGSAAFVAAGGYHHHLGFNVWRGEGVSPARAHTIGLTEWDMELPSAGDVAEARARVDAAGLVTEVVPDGFRVRDPWNNALVIRLTPRGDGRPTHRSEEQLP